VPAFCVWSVDLCLAKGIGNDFGGGGGGGGGSLSIGTVILLRVPRNSLTGVAQAEINLLSGEGWPLGRRG
jgi:hypothetical protein